MNTPVLNAPEWVEAQAMPETKGNEIIRWLEQGACWFRFKDRGLGTPPGSPAEGDCYLLPTSGLTGAWVGHENDIAFLINGSWQFIPVSEGMGGWVIDENVAIVYDSAAWTSLTAGVVIQFPVEEDNVEESATVQRLNFTGDHVDVAVASNEATVTITAPPIAPTDITGTSYTLVLSDARKYLRFTNVAAVTLTVPENATVAFPIGTIIEFEQANTGVVTLTPASGSVNLNSRGGFLASAGQYAVFQIKKTDTNAWTVIGDVA